MDINNIREIIQGDLIYDFTKNKSEINNIISILKKIIDDSINYSAGDSQSRIGDNGNSLIGTKALYYLSVLDNNNSHELQNIFNSNNNDLIMASFSILNNFSDNSKIELYNNLAKSNPTLLNKLLSTEYGNSLIESEKNVNIQSIFKEVKANLKK